MNETRFLGVLLALMLMEALAKGQRWVSAMAHELTFGEFVWLRGLCDRCGLDLSLNRASSVPRLRLQRLLPLTRHPPDWQEPVRWRVERWRLARHHAMAS